MPATVGQWERVKSCLLLSSYRPSTFMRLVTHTHTHTSRHTSCKPIRVPEELSRCTAQEQPELRYTYLNSALGLLPVKASCNPHSLSNQLSKGGRQEKGTLPPASSKGFIHYCKGFKTEVKKLRKQPGQKRHLFPTRLAFLHSDC